MRRILLVLCLLALPAGAMRNDATTQVATAPTSVTVSNATATKVFASTAGICQVAVCNEDTSIKITCGQTSAVTSNAIGLPVVAGSCYTTSYGYGGDVYCIAASGSPTVGVQSTQCH